MREGNSHPIWEEEDDLGLQGLDRKRKAWGSQERLVALNAVPAGSCQVSSAVKCVLLLKGHGLPASPRADEELA